MVIQQGIAPRERRRRVAAFWWLLPGALLLTAAIVMYRHAASTNGVTARAAGHGVRSAGGDATAAATVAASTAVSASATVPAPTTVDAPATVPANSDAYPARLAKLVTRRGSAPGTAGQNTTNQQAPEQGTAENSTPSAPAETITQARTVTRFRPGLIGGLTLRRGVSAPMPHEPVNTAVEGIRPVKHPWYMGFAAGGGGSSIYAPVGNALVTGSPVNSYYYAFAGNSTSPSPGLPQTLRLTSSANAAASKRTGTNVRPNFSYWAGIYGEKRLSARWSIDVGLSLHYYSVRLRTESQVNTYAPSSASLLVATPVTYAANAANSYSGSGEQTYINNYYFLEVPASAQWKLNHSRSLPLFWRGGAVLSYLMSSNGLYDDISSGAYKSDNGVIHRTQASVKTGLAVGLPVRGVQIQAGPEVQYALTHMLRTGSGSGHMVYGGMRVALMR